MSKAENKSLIKSQGNSLARVEKSIAVVNKLLAKSDDEIIQSITLKRIVEGHFTYRELNAKEVESVCNEIAKTIIADYYGDKEFYHAFISEDKNLDNGYYLSLIYACCAKLLDTVKYIQPNKKEYTEKMNI